MEILIAILFYLGILIPGQTYTVDDVNSAADAHLDQVEAVCADQTQMDAAMIGFDESGMSFDGEAGLVQPWIDWEPIRDDEPPSTD